MERTLDRAPDGLRHFAAESSRPAVAWSAVFAGAAVALATSIILLAVGSGLGFAAASPWPGSAPSVTSFAIGVGIWMIVVQWLSAALGGYMAGRLRTKWSGIHTHEVVFRDTAHGLLAWCVATIIVAAIGFALTASTASVATTAATSTSGYAADTLLRSGDNPALVNPQASAQISRLLAREGGASDDDRLYLANLVAAQDGIPRAEARQKVDAAVTSVREAVDKARKASSAISFFTALSMLLGAFIACAAAGYGGSYRDAHSDLREPV